MLFKEKHSQFINIAFGGSAAAEERRGFCMLDFPKYKYSGRLSGDRKSLKAIPARIYSIDTISQ